MKKKKTMMSICMAMTIGIIGYTMYQKTPKNISDIFLANIEALADNKEYSGKGYEIPGPHSIVSSEDNGDFIIKTYEYKVTCMPGGSEDCSPRTESYTVRFPKES